MSDLHQMATASAPATSANLGPAYDCMALALDIRCQVQAVTAADWAVTQVGPHRPRSDQDDVVLETARIVSSVPLAIEVAAEVPIGKGLGSSAAVSVATIAAALKAQGEQVDPDRVYRVAAELEGHADNVAAAVYGGLTLVPAEGMPIRIPIHPALHVVIALPDQELSTSDARDVVSISHPQGRVLRSLARVSALTAGLITGDAEMLKAAHGDEIHEAPRDAISPEVGKLIDVARQSGALHAARSGSGPAVLAVCLHETVADVVAGFKHAGVETLTPRLASTGLI
ncbi:MAG: hypothetical protein WAN34_02100 [Acidimicrobiia bacterium]